MSHELLIEAAKNLTKRDLIDFLTEKLSSSECPTCNKNEWEILDNLQGGLAQLPLQKGENYIMPPPSVPSMLMICQHCGFIRMHAALPIAAWKLKSWGA